MSKTILTLLFTLSFWVASAQKVYFVYLQTENEQPFFVKMNEKVYSSSASGYLILSRLKDSSYNFSVGFPREKWPEQHFSVAVNRKDHGFLVKNFGEKGWGLFDLQTLGVQMSVGDKAKTEKANVDNKDVSHFTEVLAKAANDPSLLEKTFVARVEEKKAEPILAVVKKDEPIKESAQPSVTKTSGEITAPDTKKEQSKTESSKSTVAKQTNIPETTIKKEDSSIEGGKSTAIKTVDIGAAPDNKKDEPKVEEKKPVISPNDGSNSTTKKENGNKPDEKTAVPNKSSEISSTSEKRKEESKLEGIKTEPPVVNKVELKEEKKTETKDDITVKSEPEYKASVVTKRSESSTTEGFGLVFIDTYESGAKDTVRIIIPHPKPLINTINEEPKEEKKFLDISSDTTARTEVKPIKSANKNKCTDLANDDDFIRLRKRMAGMTNDEAMVSEAKKAFKSKCYSVDYLKRLSAMFWNEQGKYQFFDAAYLFVFDTENFATLQAELKDPYYINRFKAMLRN